ncbi:G patch domain-containing protein 1 [Oryzias melastigma]|uniref:G patch domain containing 1 n=1 Tax=Oryzias melastigma TaxID=30732 RepID=A0A3B3CTV1_ORYME|nr:G patch domain-containing protein 1 [Oryzias melastigma]
MASDGGGEEDFVTYGTPLEPLEEDEPLRKPVPLHEQTVKDEKGRYQRFHGAFTGGFSAGYFNTVGSKEGWTPSTFVSSRQQKADQHLARPEDFMDEEDFSEHGIAPRQITTSREFSSGHRDEVADKARAVGAQAALIPGDLLLEELITPARSSIGVELLRRMGWREGQGVGPRVKRKARRPQTDDRARVYGCAPPPAGSEEDEDEEEFAPENVTYAPKDVTPMDFTPKSGLQGLGYRGLDPGLALQGSGAAQHIELFDPQGGARSRLFGDSQGRLRRGGVAGQAFGVGALEDDDEDIYHRDSMSRYDTVLEGEEPGDGLYGWTAPQQYTNKTGRSRDAAYLGKILEGFTLAQSPLEDKEVFPPPALPRGYRPVHHFRPKVDVLRLSGVSPALAEALKTSKGHMVKEEPQQGGRHQLDSGQRGALLGEDSLQGPRSVMDLLKPGDRDRLLRLRSSQSASSSAPSTQAPPTTDPVPSVLTPSLCSPTPPLRTPSSMQQEAQAAWRGAGPPSQTFRPFEKTPSKQARYDLYLSRLRQGDRDALEQSLDPAMTEWERSRERDEFVRASILYRPASTSLSSRFTRAEHQDDEDTVEVARDQESDVDDKQAAVKMKMFGKMTRETFEWHPDKLLCKRFNVPDPYPGSGLVGLPKVKRDKFSVFNFLTVTESREPTASPKPPDSGKKSRWDVSESKEEKKKEDLSDPLGTAKNHAETEPEPEPPAATSSRSETRTEDQEGPERGEEEEQEEEQEESRPPMDLFKAIFASSSEEKSSSSEAESSDEEETEDQRDGEAGPETEPQNLFSISTGASSSAPPPACQPSGSSQTKEEEEEVFGPKLPPPSAAVYTGGAAAPSQEDKRRRRRSKEKKPKKSKHKKEKKKKKQKKKKGKQKKSRKESERESSSEDSDLDLDPDLDPDLLLKRLKSIRSQQNR